MTERICVDADACPRVIKDMLYRVADRVAVEVVLVANQALTTPPSRFIRAVQVAGGFDEADQYIAERSRPGDLVITADIPLAAELVRTGADVGVPLHSGTYTSMFGPAYETKAEIGCPRRKDMTSRATIGRAASRVGRAGRVPAVSSRYKSVPVRKPPFAS